MNAFEAYAAQAGPIIPDRRPDRRKKAPSQLDLKMEEKQRLTRAYRQAKRREREEILKAEPRLLDVIRYLRKVGPEDGDELLTALGECEWLLHADQKVRGFALSLIARRSDKIALAVGRQPLDDPMPPHLGGYDSVFTQAQRILRAGGPL